MRIFIYTLLLGLLLVGCSHEPQIDSSSELVAIDFVCDEITTRADESESFMFTLVGDVNSGKPLSDEYSYNNGVLTSTSKMLAANKATYNLVIASPATEMVAIPETSAYGYMIERKLTSAEQTYINTTPISVAVWGITANSDYIHNLGSVKLQEQRSKVKVQFRVLNEDDPRTITKLYYSNLYDIAYTCPNFGVLYGNNKPNNDAYNFAEFAIDDTRGKTYCNTVSNVEPTISGDDVTYFISGDYSTNETDAPKLCIGLLQDGKEKLIEMGLNIKMEPMTTYTYDIRISSAELTVRVFSMDEWVDTEIEGEVGEGIGSFTINIATGVVSDWKPGCDENDGNSDIGTPDAPAEIETDYTNEKSSNCYILNPSNDKTMIYYIPVKRIDEFWGDAKYVADGEKNTLSKVDDNWETVIFWHDFSSPQSADAISKLKVEKSVSPTGNAAVKVTLPKEFHVSDNHCNVGYVVRRTDTKEVLWSWHLWITDYNPYKTVKDGVTYSDNGLQVIGGDLHSYNSDIFINGIYKDKKIMDRSIGARSSGNGEVASFGSLYYQYGRKDPFSTVALYANGYYNTNRSSSTQQSFEYAVMNPEKFIIKSGNWCNSPAAQSTEYIWNDCKIKVEGYKMGKSIFDPSPLGFRVPVNGAWSDFDETTFTPGIWGIGYNYRDYAPYPALGCRAASSGKFDNATNGCWSATPASDMNGYNFNFKTGFISNSSKNNRAYGYCVRPVQE